MSEAVGDLTIRRGKRGSGRPEGRSRRRTRRGLIAGALAAGGAGALAACGPLGAPGAVSTTKQPVTLEYWDWHGPEQAVSYQPMVDAFQKQAPAITLHWVGIGSGPMLDKVTAAVAGGTPPDMVYLDNQHQ